MTFYDLEQDERIRVRQMIEKIIGTKKDCVNDDMTRDERINARFKYDKLFDQLAKVWIKAGDKALAMNFMDYGSVKEGVTPAGNPGRKGKGMMDNIYIPKGVSVPGGRYWEPEDDRTEQEQYEEWKEQFGDEYYNDDELPFK